MRPLLPARRQLAADRPDRAILVYFHKILILLILSVLTLGLPSVLTAGITHRISVSGDGREGNGPSRHPAMSADGGLVVFASDADNLDDDNHTGLFVRDVNAGTTTFVAAGEQPALSADGSTVAYVVDDNGTQDLFVQPLEGIIIPITQVDGAADTCAGPALSADGSLVVFAANSAPGGVVNIFLHDSSNPGSLELISEAAVGGGIEADDACSGPALSADGRYVVFSSMAGNLVAGVASGVDRIYLHDRQAVSDKTVLVSKTITGDPAGSDCSPPAISADGNWVAFSCGDGGLVAADNNNAVDTFLYDVSGRTITRAGPGGNGGSALDLPPALSADGQKVLFVSAAGDLVADDDNGKADLFLYDTVGMQTSRLNLSSSGAEANAPCGRAALAIDGQGQVYAAFESTAANLATGDLNGAGDIFFRDPAGLYNDPRTKGMLMDGASSTVSSGGAGATAGYSGSSNGGRYNINTATLNMALEHRLFRMNTRGPEIDITLYYNADPGSTPGTFGHGWSLGQDWELIPGNGGMEVVLRKGNGQEVVFTSDISLQYPDTDGDGWLDGDPGVVYPIELTPPNGNQDRLLLMGGRVNASPRFFTFEYHEATTRWVYWFNADWYTNTTRGLLERIEDTYFNGSFYNHGIDCHLWDSENPSNCLEQTPVLLKSISPDAQPPDGSSRDVTFTYNEDGLCTRIDTPEGDGRSATFEYDANGNLIKVTDLAGYIYHYTYDAEHYMTAKRVGSKTVTFEYGSRGAGGGKRITRVVDGGAAVTFTSSGGSVTRAGGNASTTFASNARGQTTAITNLLGTRTIGYTGGLTGTFTDTNHKSQTFTYDNGRLKTRTDGEGHPFTYTYDDSGSLTSYETPDGPWDYTYNDHRQMLTSCSPMEHCTQYEYDGAGQLSKVIHPNGNFVAFGYDDYGNVTSVKDALNNPTTYTYDDAGLRCIRIEDARSNSKDLTYDGNDRLTEIDYAGGGSVRYTYDPFHMTAVTDELGRTTRVTRNLFGHITQRILPMGNATRYAYDADSRRVAVVDPLGRSTRTDYDVSTGKRVETVTDPLGLPVKYEYDGENNLVGITDARSNTIKFGYDGNNRLVKIDPLWGADVEYTRDAMGRIDSIKNGRFATAVDLDYDADGRLTDKDLAVGDDYDFQYDESSNLTGMTIAGVGSFGFDYTLRNELQRIDYPLAGPEMEFAYDQTGNLTTARLKRTPANDEQVVKYTYDNINRVSLPRRLKSGLATDVRPQRAKPNQVTGAAWDDNRSIDCRYDAAGRLTQLERSNNYDTTMAYDPNGRLIRIDHGGVGRLEYAYNAADETVAVEVTRAGAAGERFIAAYDTENRLISLERGGVATTYTYDGHGNRIRKTTGGTETWYLYDRSGRLHAEAGAGGAILARYVWIGHRLGAMHRGGTQYFYHFDRNGNTLALTDGNGVAASYAYEPYGAVTRLSGDVENPFTYGGAYGVMDEGGGLFFMRQRFYDGVTGRFLQRDPAVVQGAGNLYKYAHNNPLNYVDPDGDIAFMTVIGIIGAAKAIHTGYKYAKKWRDKNMRRFRKSQSGSEDDQIDAELERREHMREASKEGANVGFEVTKTALETATGMGNPIKDVYDTARDVQEYATGGGEDDDEDDDGSSGGGSDSGESSSWFSW